MSRRITSSRVSLNCLPVTSRASCICGQGGGGCWAGPVVDMLQGRMRLYYLAARPACHIHHSGWTSCITCTAHLQHPHSPPAAPG